MYPELPADGSIVLQFAQLKWVHLGALEFGAVWEMAAETRRIELTPVTITGTLPAPVPESPAVPNLPSESSKSDDAASVRLELVLLESDDLNFPEFYYPQLVFQNTRDTLNMVCINQMENTAIKLMLSLKSEKKNLILLFTGER